MTSYIRALAGELRALGIDSRVVNRRRAKIAAASHRHQDVTTLRDLNDDCILEILSMKCLRVQDLCSVAEASCRLKEIAGRVFKREHKTCNLNSLSEGETKTAERILRNFGSVIRHLEIEGAEFSGKCSSEILESVAEYCSNTLQSLDLEDFKVSANLTGNLGPLFRNLRKFRIKECNFVGSTKELFANSGSLVELNISRCRDANAFILENTFPKLQRFGCGHGVTSDSFISRHVNLKSLRIGNDVGSSALQRIADCKQLEKLHCYIPENGTLDLSNLGQLREVWIYCSERNVLEAAPGLTNLQFLEDLTIAFAEIDPEFIGTLSQLKRLRVLELWACPGLQNWNQMGDVCQLTTLEVHSTEHVDLDIPLLVKSLSKLKSLRVAVGGFKMDLATYLRILDVVRPRPEKSKLLFRLYCNEPHDYDHLLPDFTRNAHLVEMILDSELFALTPRTILN